jgi:hypothetical protein
MAFGVFDVKMQFLSRKKPIFCEFWSFLVIFEFELMPAGASLWSSYQSVTWYQYRTVQYRTVSKKYAQNSKIQGPVQYSWAQLDTVEIHTVVYFGLIFGIRGRQYLYFHSSICSYDRISNK